MSRPGPILHHDPAGLASRKLQTVFAIKDMAWRSAEYSGEPPDVPGAGMAMPVLQIGADFHAGAIAALLAVETLCPSPTLFPNGNRGMPLALNFWARRFVDEFQASNADPPVFAAHADLIERQLHDGRAFLQGADAGLADAESFSAVSVCLNSCEEPGRLLAPFDRLPGWVERMRGLGIGRKTEAGPSDIDVAIASAPAKQQTGQQSVRVITTRGKDQTTGRLDEDRGTLTLDLADPDRGNVRIIVSRLDTRLED